MNYIEKKLILSQEKLDDEFIELFKMTYGTAKHWDNVEKTIMRNADISDGSIDPTPELDSDGNPTGRKYIIALWPEKFIKDFSRSGGQGPFAGLEIQDVN